MRSKEDLIRTAIAEQAGEWFVTSDDAPLDARDSAALTTWLKTSPAHIEQFLGVSVIARDLRQAADDPRYSLDAMVALARTEDDAPVLLPRSGTLSAASNVGPRRWLKAAVALALAASVVLSLGVLSFWGARPDPGSRTADGLTALHVETGHGQQIERRLSDGSILHLNTDTAVTVRYDKAQRVVTLTSGQVEFEVAHETHRRFRVIAGSAEVVDLGTKFEVRVNSDSTVVTVVEGRVAVQPSASFKKHASRASENQPRRVVELNADQQLSVADGRWLDAPVTVDARRTTAWLRRQIVFDQEPLEQVAAEFNRYVSKPFEIATPALRSLQISGVFATDDAEGFIAFLRSLDGVRVEVTATRVRVFQKHSAAAHNIT